MYLQAEPLRLKENWEKVSIGKTPNVEDAVFADMNNEGLGVVWYENPTIK